MMLSERLDVCKSMIMSYFEMCPKHKLDQCHIVYGYGFFQEELLTSWDLHLQTALLITGIYLIQD